MFLLWLLPEKVILQKLQFSLRVIRVSRKLANKMVPIFLEKILELRKSDSFEEEPSDFSVRLEKRVTFL